MGVIFEAGYSLPNGDEPLTHARIAHASNWLTGGTVTASSTATDFDAGAANNSLTYEKWKGTTAATWEYDHGSAVECDYCVIGAHTMGTDSATFKVQGWNGAAWVDLCADTSPTENSPIMVIFEPRSYDRWRVNISTGTPEIGVIKFGLALQMQRPIYGQYTPFAYARQTQMRANYSETGEILGRTKQRTFLEFPIEWRQLTRTWLDANWYAALKAIEDEPFFIAPVPSSFPDVALAQVLQPPSAPVQTASGFLGVSLNIRARAYD